MESAAELTGAFCRTRESEYRAQHERAQDRLAHGAAVLRRYTPSMIGTVCGCA